MLYIVEDTEYAYGMLTKRRFIGPFVTPYLANKHITDNKLVGATVRSLEPTTAEK